jgi:DNA-binding transcriptional ArsR family regulator
LITFRFADDDPAAFRFALSRLSEAAFSLHVLAKPKHHPVQHVWIRRARGFSTELKREIRAFESLFHDAVPNCLLPGGGDEPPSFEAELAQLAALDPEAVAYELAVPLFFYLGPRNGGRSALERPEIRERVLRAAASHGPESARLGALIYEDPPALRERLTAFFARYWEEGFADEWDRITAQLRRAAEQARERIATEGISPLAEELQPPLEVDRARRLIHRPSGHEHVVDVDREHPLLLLPSVYVWPHARVNCDGPWPLTLAFPALFVSSRARRERPPAELVATLRALADLTRLQAMRLLGEQPRTTEELAPLVGISEAGLSKHLRILSRAGLVSHARQGYYVLYSADRERLAALGPEVLEFVEAAGATTAAAAAFRRAPRGPGT